MSDLFISPGPGRIAAEDIVGWVSSLKKTESLKKFSLPTVANTTDRDSESMVWRLRLRHLDQCITWESAGNVSLIWYTMMVSTRVMNVCFMDLS